MSGNNSPASVPNYENFAVRYSNRSQAQQQALPDAPSQQPSQPSQPSKSTSASNLIAAARSYSQRAGTPTSMCSSSVPPPFQPAALAAVPQVTFTAPAPPLPAKNPTPMIGSSKSCSCLCGGHQHPEHAATAMSPPSYRQYSMGRGLNGGGSMSPLLGISSTTTGDSRRDPAGAKIVQPSPVAIESYVKVFGPNSVCSYNSSAVPRPLKALNIKPNPLIVIGKITFEIDSNLVLVTLSRGCCASCSRHFLKIVNFIN